MFDLGIINGRVYLEGSFKKTNVYMKNGKIEYIGNEIRDCEQSFDCENSLVLPGLIDPHVHFSLKTDEFVSSDDFETGSKSGAFGGVTTYVDFLDPITHEDEFEKALRIRKEEAKNSCVDYSFHATIGDFKGNVRKLASLCRKNGISSVKVFTTYSESGRRSSYDVIEELLMMDVTVLAHAEEESMINSSWKEIKNYEKSRPVEAEIAAASKLGELAEKTKGKLYLVHISAGTTAMVMAKKYSKLLGNKIFMESCPHYFYLSSNIFNSKDGGLYLVNPPLRESKEIIKLRRNIKYIDSVGTDHCSYMIEDKMKYDTADKVPKGIGGIENSFVLMYNLFGSQIIPKFTKTPAEIFGLKNKGSIEVGKDGDIIVFNDTVSNNIKETHSKSDYNVYAGLKIKGKIIGTISKGKIVVDRDEFFGGEGNFVERG